jgi:predicted secreted protein
MKITSIVAIYALFWVMSAFVCMPFGIKTHDEVGAPKVQGQAESAPANFQPCLIAKRATVLAAALFALYYANYTIGWIGVDDIDIGRLIGL